MSRPLISYSIFSLMHAHPNDLSTLLDEAAAELEQPRKQWHQWEVKLSEGQKPMSLLRAIAAKRSRLCFRDLVLDAFKEEHWAEKEPSEQDFIRESFCKSLYHWVPALDHLKGDERLNFADFLGQMVVEYLKSFPPNQINGYWTKLERDFQPGQEISRKVHSGMESDEFRRQMFVEIRAGVIKADGETGKRL